MKKILLFVIFSFGQNLHAQGVMPVPGMSDTKGNPPAPMVPPAGSPDCKADQNFNIISEPLLKPFRINLSALCSEDSLYGDAFLSSTNYLHNRVRCDEVSLCAPVISTEDQKQAENIIADNIPNAVLIGELTKEIADNREYNIALARYEQKYKVKVCEDAPIDFDCDHKLRRSLSTVADSLVDFSEFKKAPISSDDLQVFIPQVFFSGPSSLKATLEDLKKNCSKKLSLKRVCETARDRLVQVKDCDGKSGGKNCFENEQRAWASITNDMKNDRSLFMAIEKQLCLPSRVSKSATQTAQGGDASFMMVRRQRFLADSGQTRTQQIISLANANAQTKAADSPKDNDSNRSPDGSDIKKQDSDLGGMKANATENTADVIHGFENRDSKTLSESFSSSMEQAADSSKGITNGTVSNSVLTNNWNNDFANRARDLAEEQRAINEEQKRKQDEASSDSLAQLDKKKKEEIDTLTSQISGLKSKLDEMNSKVDELKGKKGDGAVAEKDKETLDREADIAELKKKIAELEADKKKKETESKVAKEEEDARQAARVREEQVRSTYTSPFSQANYSNRNKQNSVDQSSEATANHEREKVANSMSNGASSADVGRSPASFGNTGGSGGTVSSQLVLKAVGTQATPDSNIVYMTQNELQHYPFRLNGNASAVEIEKMLEGNKGSTIILGDSEQIVPIVENGAVALDEQGKIKYKRIKISLVKNDKEKKQKIAREISSIADLKREEQKKRDLIRYQEMKKSLRLKTDN